MKFLRFALLALLVLGAAGTTWANDPQVVFDPMATTDFFGFYDITQAGVPFTGLSWGSCAFAQSRSSAFNGLTGCMYFVNDTGAPISDLTFTFDLTSVGAGPLNCSYVDGTLNNPNCPGTLPAGTNALEFNGGNPIPASTPNTLELFIIGVGGLANPNTDFMPESLQVPAHDPGTMFLVLSGLGLLGLCGMKRTS